MNKEGHLGVVKSTEKPIVKVAVSHYIHGEGGSSLNPELEFPRSRQQSNIINGNFGINPLLSNGGMQNTIPTQTSAE